MLSVCMRLALTPIARQFHTAVEQVTSVSRHCPWLEAYPASLHPYGVFVVLHLDKNADLQSEYANKQLCQLFVSNALCDIDPMQPLNLQLERS